MCRSIHVAALLALGSLLASQSQVTGQFRKLPSATGAPLKASPRFYSTTTTTTTAGFRVTFRRSYGGYLHGVADVIRAQGLYLIKTQKAFLLKEKVRAAKLENRKLANHYWLYRQDHIPSLNEVREKSQQEELRRSLSHPPVTEICSGKTLNDILVHIQKLQSYGYHGPDVPLSIDILKQINVDSGVGHANAGLLKSAGNLHWPIGLQFLKPEKDCTILRLQVDVLLVKAKGQAAKGRAQAGTIVKLQGCVDSLRKHLVKNQGQHSFRDYSNCKQFLGELDNAIALLSRPDASRYVNGKYSLKAGTVKDLVKFVSTNGLQFVQAVSGQESAYRSLHNALVRYYLGASVKLSTTPDPRGSAFPYRINPYLVYPDLQANQ